MDIKYVPIFSTTFSSNISHSLKKFSEILSQMYMSSCKVLVILTKVEFLDRYYKNNLISNFTKIRSMVAELFNADGQPDEQRDGKS